MITQEELEQVADRLANEGLSESVVADLRKCYPGKHFTLCIEDDIHGGKPVFKSKEFDIYLVNSSDHCSVLTNDFECASGFVIAEYIDE